MLQQITVTKITNTEGTEDLIVKDVKQKTNCSLTSSEFGVHKYLLCDPTTHCGHHVRTK